MLRPNVTAIGWENCASLRRMERCRTAVMIFEGHAFCLAHHPNVFQLQTYFLNSISLLSVTQQESLSPGVLLPYHFSNSNHPHKFKEGMVSIMSPYSSPVYFCSPSLLPYHLPFTSRGVAIKKEPK